MKFFCRWLEGINAACRQCLFVGGNRAFEAAETVVLLQQLNGNGYGFACGQSAGCANQFARAEHLPECDRRLTLLRPVQAGPDADGLRHQFQCDPAGKIALRIKERCENAAARHRDETNSDILNNANHLFE